MWSALNPDFFSCSGVNLQRRRCEGSSEGRVSSRGWVVEEVGGGYSRVEEEGEGE